MAHPPMLTTLYRIYDAEGQLLYVGIAWNVAARMSQHRADRKPWYRDAARIDLEHLPSRQEAEIAEQLAIRDESPIHNRDRSTSRLKAV